MAGSAREHAAGLPAVITRLRGGAVLLDDRTAPSLRAVLGAAMATAREAEFAISRVRLAAIDLSARELSGLRRCRVLLGQVDAHTFAEAGAASAASAQHRSHLAVLKQFLESGRAEVRAAGSEAWSPDFSVLRGVHWDPAGGAEAVALLGAHYFAKPFPVRGAVLTCILTEPEAVAALHRRFRELWARGYDVAPILLDAIEKMLREAGDRGSSPWPGAGGASAPVVRETAARPRTPCTPREAALAALRARFGPEPEPAAAGQGGEASRVFDLASFQRDAVARAEAIVRRRRGVLVADAVGLGKTFVALDMIERRLRAGATVVVAIPAALRKTWLLPLRRLAREVGARLESGRGGGPLTGPRQEGAATLLLTSHTALSRDTGLGAAADLVVVDEAHAFRNPGTLRYRALATLCRSADVVLLTATPINNSLSDLYFQLRLFSGNDGFRDVGVPDLRAAFEAGARTPGAAGIVPVLREVMVRRTRPFLREHYAGAAWAGQAPLSFPRRAPPRAIRYAMDRVAPGLFGEVAAVLEGLTLAPYRAHAYGAGAAHAEGPAELVRITLLKRLESSGAAFRASVLRQVRVLESFLDALARGFLLGPRDRGGHRADSDDGAIQLLLEPLALAPFPAGLDRAALEADARGDLEALRRLLGRLDAVSGAADPKLEALGALLDGLAGEKVVVFTEFRETARYLARALERRGGVGLVDGEGALLGGRPAARREVVERFAPRSNGAAEPPARERVDLLIATDVLSEGLNLQDAAHVVSYDLPWNPIRLVQRVGRVDRLGSAHAMVHPYHFVPERGLEELLGLMRRLRAKLRSIRATVPGDDPVLPGAGGAERDGALERVLAGDPAVVDDLERMDAAPFEAEERLRALWRGASRGDAAPAGPGPFRATVVDPAASRDLVLVALERGGRPHWVVFDPATGGAAENDLAAAEVVAAALRVPRHGAGKETGRGGTAEPSHGLVVAAEGRAVADDGRAVSASGAETDRARAEAAESAAVAWLARDGPTGAYGPKRGVRAAAARRLLRALGRGHARYDAALCGRVDRLLATLDADDDLRADAELRRTLRSLEPAAGLESLVDRLEDALGAEALIVGERAPSRTPAHAAVAGAACVVRATIELLRSPAVRRPDGAPPGAAGA